LLTENRNNQEFHTEEGGDRTKKECSNVDMGGVRAGFAGGKGTGIFYR